MAGDGGDLQQRSLGRNEPGRLRFCGMRCSYKSTPYAYVFDYYSTFFSHLLCLIWNILDLNAPQRLAVDRIYCLFGYHPPFASLVATSLLCLGCAIASPCHNSAKLWLAIWSLLHKRHDRKVILSDPVYVF